MNGCMWLHVYKIKRPLVIPCASPGGGDLASRASTTASPLEELGRQTNRLCSHKMSSEYSVHKLHSVCVDLLPKSCQLCHM